MLYLPKLDEKTEQRLKLKYAQMLRAKNTNNLLRFVCEFGGEWRGRLGKKGMSKWKK